jgi:hypothetical protein
MASLIPWKRKKAELARKSGELVSFEDFPFSLSRMRDDCYKQGQADCRQGRLREFVSKT